MHDYSIAERRPAGKVGLLIILGGGLILAPAVVAILSWVQILVTYDGLGSNWEWSGIALAFTLPGVVAAMGLYFVFYGRRLMLQGRN